MVFASADGTTDCRANHGCANRVAHIGPHAVSYCAPNAVTNSGAEQRTNFEPNSFANCGPHVVSYCAPNAATYTLTDSSADCKAHENADIVAIEQPDSRSHGCTHKIAHGTPN